MNVLVLRDRKSDSDLDTNKLAVYLQQDSRTEHYIANLCAVRSEYLAFVPKGWLSQVCQTKTLCQVNAKKEFNFIPEFNKVCYHIIKNQNEN